MKEARGYRVVKQKQWGNALIVVLLVASLFMGLTGALGTQLLTNLSATKHRLDSSAARYAAYAGLQHALFELKQNPAWEDGLIGVPLGESESLGYTLEVTNNSAPSSPGATKTAPDGTVVPAGEVYLVAIGIVNERETTLLHAVTGNLASNAPELDHAAFADTDLNFSMAAKSLSYDPDATTFSFQAGSTKLIPSETKSNGDIGSNRYLDLSGASSVAGMVYSSSITPATVTSTAAPPPSAMQTLSNPIDVPRYSPPVAASNLLQVDGPTLNSPLPNRVNAYSALSLDDGETLTIGPGRYYFPDGIEVSGTLAAGSGVDHENPIVFYIGNDARFHGQACVNPAGKSKNFQFYFVDHSDDGTSQEFSMNGESQVFAAVVGDTAEGKFAGNSSFYGGFLGRSVEATGEAQLVYDESLQNEPLTVDASLGLSGITEPKPKQLLLSYSASREFVERVEDGTAVYSAERRPAKILQNPGL